MARNSLKNVFRLIDAAKESLPPEQDFLNDLKRSIEMSANKDSRPPSRTYKPSGMNCIRQSYYQIVGEQPDETQSNYTLVGICNVGVNIHIFVQHAVEQMKEKGGDCACMYGQEMVR